MEEKKLTIQRLEKNLIEILEDEKEDILNDKYPEDRITEIVDDSVPVYTYDLLEVAQSDLWLAVGVPEIYAFTGEKNAINAIAGNIYERLNEKAQAWFWGRFDNKK